MLLVFFFRLRVDQNVIDKNDDKLVQERSEYPIHQLHENCWSIRQPERHDLKLVVPITSSECGLRNVFLSHPQLVVTGPQINLREELSTLEMIKQLIYPWHRVLVLDCDCIQLTIVNAQPKRPVLLFGEQSRRRPWRSAMTDEAQSQQLLNLFIQLLQFCR